MRKNYLFLLALLLIGFTACQKADEVVSEDQVSNEVLQKIRKQGFSTHGVIKAEGGYIVEGDIFLPTNRLDEQPRYVVLRAGDEEQYHTTNLVNTGGGVRTITMFAQQGTCTSCYSAGMIAGLDLAIARYNNENLNIRFQRVTSSTGANIIMRRLTRSQERQGVLGSAGFPTASGDPYNQILMSGVLESSYGLSTAGIATIIAHEMGHCIGFRHTDYFNRAISCGGATSNEGASTVGAIHIPGTPTGASLSAKSWMLACTDGSDRPFNPDDRTALNYLY
ncbi:MAG: zinc-dependent metalloprotease [Microscillaceae bacterium]|jgi:hypothetical protein|nr:zinc-dependent metalloprotease [Microscillaceae bacterium]